jgi:hypothetical protein
MNRPRLTRILRIAWSVAWGIVAVLLVALWVRSYWSQEGLFYTRNTTQVSVFTSGGIAGFNYSSYPRGTLMGDAPGIKWLSNPMRPDLYGKALQWDSGPQRLSIKLPAVCCVGAFVLLAAVVWLPLKRFSLRTLLIATTLVAVGLGLTVWLVSAL